MTEVNPLPPRSILVLGAGELGLPVLSNLARVASRAPGSTVSVLLRSRPSILRRRRKSGKPMSFVAWESKWSLRTW